MAESSHGTGLSIGVRGAHITALAALLVLFCTVVPTGLLRDHEINLISHDIKKNHVGEIINLQLGSNATDRGLATLAGWANLQRLNLASNPFGGGGPKITDAGMPYLQEMTNSQWLSLGGTAITDTGLVHLKELTNLQTLNLYNTQITDAGLVHLKELTKLRALGFTDTKVTDAGVAELKKALPNCRIVK